MRILKGKHVIQAALQARTALHGVYIDKAKSSDPSLKSLIQSCKKQKIRLSFVTQQQLLDLHPDSHESVLAIANPEHAPTLKEILANPEKYPCILLLDHLEDPFNFGGLLRTAEAFGVPAVLYPKKRQVPLTPGVMKVASGATEYLDIIDIGNVAQCLRACRKAGYWIYAADSNQGVAISEFTPQFPAVIVAGNEANGLASLTQSLCDEFVQIPLSGQTESLNVGVAMGIIIHHIMGARPA